ncbi:MAG: RDD family protein [Pseudomonadota bacterium]
MGTTARNGGHAAALLDTRVGVETPEGVSIALSPAGPVPRALAWVLDLLLRLGVYMIGAMFLPLLGKSGTGLILLLVFLLEWFYPVLFEVLNRGVTPGKAALGLAVVEEDGRPVGWTASTVRNFLRIADMLPFGYCFGLLSMLLTERFQRLGDLAAGTLVVHRGRPERQRRTTPIVALPQAPAVVLDAGEQHALVALAARHGRLSEERLDELAALAPVLTGQDPARRRTRLLGIARYLAGER